MGSSDASGTVTWSVSASLTLTDSSTNGGRHLGRVKAGTETGKFHVVARVHPGKTADTATVTVTTRPVASIVVIPADARLSVG